MWPRIITITPPPSGNFDISPLRTSPDFGIIDALGRFEVRERSAAGVQTMWFGPWTPRKIGWANSSTEEFRFKIIAPTKN